MARFFISHSAKDDVAAQEVLAAVQDRIVERGHHVFADSAIPPGAPWRSVLNHELARCDAAVVLLNQEALESDWVRREVHMLLWRHYLGSPVRIRAVLLDGVRPGDVNRSGFGELRELQFILPEKDGRTAAEIARLAIDDFGDFIPYDDALRIWTSRVVDLIRRVEIGDTLHHFARALGVRETELDRLVLDEGYRFLAHQLLDRADREQAYYAVAGIRHVMGRDGTAALSRQVVPALVDAVAARLLVRPRAADGAGGHRSRAVFALNAQACVTALLYVRRATCGEAGFRCAQVSATVGEDLVPELVDRCRAAVLRMLNVRHSWQDAQVQAWLRRHADTGIEGLKAGYLIVDPAGAPMAGVAEAVAAVRADFRWLTVILLTGLSVPDDEVLDSLGLGQVIVLRPELDEDDEFELGRTLEAFREMVHEEVV